MKLSSKECFDVVHLEWSINRSQRGEVLKIKKIGP